MPSPTDPRIAACALREPLERAPRAGQRERRAAAQSPSSSAPISSSRRSRKRSSCAARVLDRGHDPIAERLGSARRRRRRAVRSPVRRRHGRGRRSRSREPPAVASQGAAGARRARERRPPTACVSPSRVVQARHRGAAADRRELLAPGVVRSIVVERERWSTTSTAIRWRRAPPAPADGGGARTAGRFTRSRLPYGHRALNRCEYAPFGKPTPVSRSESSHSRRAVSASWRPRCGRPASGGRAARSGRPGRCRRRRGRSSVAA